MPFDLVVAISMHFYERCQTKEKFEITDLRRREILHLRSVCPFWLFFGVQNFELQYFLFFFWGGGGGAQKTEYFWRYEDFVDIFLGNHKIGLYYI